MFRLLSTSFAQNVDMFAAIGFHSRKTSLNYCLFLN